MNSNQLFSPETSPSDSKSQGRARLKIAVFSVIGLHVAGLMVLLMTQGCKREVPPEPEIQPEPPVMDMPTNPPIGGLDTGSPTGGLSGQVVEPPFQPPIQPPIQPPVAPATSEYVVQKGDSFYTIAKTHGTTIAAIQAANPGVVSTKLKIGQKLNLPPPGPEPSAGVTPAVTTGGNEYKVVSGDTLSKIAKRNGTTVKEIKALNNLATDQIKVGQMLKLPVKAPAPVISPAPLPEPAPMAPMVPPPGQ